MNRYRLPIRHTWDGKALSTTVSVELISTADTLHMMVQATKQDDPAPDAPVGELDGLWNHEVVELFIKGPDERYLELELGPHGHHLVIELQGVRQRSRLLPATAQCTIDGALWQGSLVVDAQYAPAKPWRMNAFAIGGTPRTYAAATPLLGPKPDFHQPERFQPASTFAVLDVRS